MAYDVGFRLMSDIVLYGNFLKADIFWLYITNIE